MSIFLFTDSRPWCFQTRARIIVLLCFVVAAEGGMDPNPFNKLLSGMNMHSPTIWVFTKVPKFDTYPNQDVGLSENRVPPKFDTVFIIVSISMAML